MGEGSKKLNEDQKIKLLFLFDFLAFHRENAIGSRFFCKGLARAFLKGLARGSFGLVLQRVWFGFKLLGDCNLQRFVSVSAALAIGKL